MAVLINYLHDIYCFYFAICNEGRQIISVDKEEEINMPGYVN